MMQQSIELIGVIQEDAGFWFWLGFWGNGFTAMFVFLLLNLGTVSAKVQFAETDPTLFERLAENRLFNRPTYYVIAMIFLATWKLYQAIQAFIYPIDKVDFTASIGQMATGLAFGAGWFFYQFGNKRNLTASEMKRTLLIAGICLMTLFMIMFSLGWRIAVRRGNDLLQENNKLLKKSITVGQQQVISDSSQRRTDSANTVKFDTLNAKVDRIDSTTEKISKKMPPK